MRALLSRPLAAAILTATAGLVGACGPQTTPAPSTTAAASTQPVAVTTADSPASVPSTDPWRVPDVIAKPALRYVKFETIGVEDGLPSERVTALLVEGADIVVGTEAGLAIREGTDWRVIDEDAGLSNNYVTSISRDEATGDLWVSTLAGLNRLSGGEITNFTQLNSGLMNDVIYHVVVSEGMVWVGTAAGASIFDTQTGAWDIFDTGNSIMHEPWCYTLAMAPGRAWIGLWGGAIIERDLATGDWREYRDPDGEMEIDLLRDDGPIHEVTSFLAYDSGVLWQGTYFGLARYDGRRWNSYVAADTGLPGDFIAHVDAMGHTVWIATDEGLGVFDGSTCVTYRARVGGGGSVIVWKDGALVEETTLETGPPHDYLLWVQGGEADVWFATARGLCHGMTDGYTPPAASDSGDTR